MILLSGLLIAPHKISAQLFGPKNISIQGGVINFNSAILNNSKNSGLRPSYFTELNRYPKLGKKISLNYGIGAGTLNNPDNRFSEHQNLSFLRLKLGLVLNRKMRVEGMERLDFTTLKSNPYLTVAYNLDIFDKNYTSINPGPLGSSLKLGAGYIHKINSWCGVMAEVSHNQRITLDYRTYFQFGFGLICSPAIFNPQ